MENWAINISRGIFSSDINFKPPEWFKIRIYLLANVQRQDYRNLKRWQWYFKYSAIAETLWVKYNTVNKFMVWAESGKMLARQKTMRWVVITIVNYDDYQDFGKLLAIQKQDKSKIKARLYNEEDKEDNKYIQHGKFVKLTEKEYQKLSNDFNKKTIDGKIEDVNNYCGSKWVKYKDYNLTVRSFLKRDGIKKSKDLSLSELWERWFELDKQWRLEMIKQYWEEKMSEAKLYYAKNK